MSTEGLTKWVATNLKKMKDQPDMEIVRIKWNCPMCGKKYKMKLPYNKYIGEYTFNCADCGYTIDNVQYLHCFQS